ncbi:hypothetical protein [Peribacillus sp. NPDC096540]
MIFILKDKESEGSEVDITAIEPMSIVLYARESLIEPVVARGPLS